MKQNEHSSKLKIIPLGGLEQIGMNITAFEYEDSIIVVDCGLSFPEDDMYGIEIRKSSGALCLHMVMRIISVRSLMY